MSNEKFKVKFGLAVGDTAATIDGTTGNIVTNGDIDIKGGDITNTTGNLTLNSSSGTIILNSNGTLGVTLQPITGFNPNADFTGNIVKGAIRTGAGEASGNVYEFFGGANPSTGISIDNTDKPADRTSIVLRNYGASLSGGLPRNNIIMEAARGSAASPTAVQNTDNLMEIQATGYTSAGWLSDQNVSGVPAPAGIVRIRAAENWTNGVNNVGATFQVVLQPTATAMTAGGGSLLASFINNPQATTIRSDSILTQNKAGTQTTSLDNIGQYRTSGSLTALGTTTFNSELALNAVSELLNTNTAAGTSVAIQTNYRPSSGSATYSVPQSGNKLGNFRFNSYSDAAGSYVLANQVIAEASENWTPTANGSRISFFANKQGQSWTTGHTNVGLFSPEITTLDATTITLNSNGTLGFTLEPITGFNPNADFTGNIVKGAIRDSTAKANGDIWQVVGPAAQTTGISIDNTDKVADRTGIVLRNYGASLAGAVPRNTIIGEGARGTAAAPLNLNSGNSIIDIIANGYTSTGWATDLVTAPGIMRYVTTEAWNNGSNNVGTGFQVLTLPTATALSTTNLQTTISANPQTFNTRSDSYNWSKGKAFIGFGSVPTMMTLNENGGKVGLTVSQTRATTASDFALVNFNTQRSTDGINYTPTQNNDILGSFKWNGNAYTSTSPGVPAGPGAEVIAKATENWTATANGTRYNFFCMKTGTLNSYDTFGGNPDSFSINSDIITFKNFDSSVTRATIDSTAATFTVPVTTEITTTTISEGTTYTPAATVDNNISVQINTLAGGTTVIDLASLTGNNRGASYNILVFNNTGSGTPIQVKNTRINTNNLMTHTITTGNRIIINAYIVGDYATATHLNVA
jgi:hypothetical protein